MSTSCTERDGLLSAYKSAVQEWVQAVTVMGDRAGARNAELLALLSAIGVARGKSLDAKAAYMKHTEEHACTAEVR